MIIDEKDYLAHYGILRRSGRYPWGSGKDPAQRSRTFFDTIGELRKQGLTDTEIARGFGMTTTEFRDVRSIAKNAKRAADVALAQKYKEKGYSNIAIGKKMDIPESSVRALLAPGVKDKLDVLKTTSNMLKDQVDKKGMIDVGTGVEHWVGVSRTKLNSAIRVLQDQGYQVHTFKEQQVGTGLMTEYKVLVPPGVTQKQAWQNRYNLRQITEFSEDGGRTFLGLQTPMSVSSKRIAVAWKEDGGAEADGVIYVRPGVSDLSLGGSRYAQVRVAVDGTHYLKGMAMYKDDLPKGTDIVFNTNKSRSPNKLDAMKPLKTDKDGNIDPDNPFGSQIKRQLIEKDSTTGKARVTSAMNIVNEEGDWERWSRSLSSQVLSKQPHKLAKEQLDMKFEQKKNELDSIMALTNPAVRKRLLLAYADDADSSAVHLKAANLPRQANHVILPIKSMKETEVYAPQYRDGERVVLIRHPHGGIFEIPELTVNNRNPEGRRLLGKGANAAKDAVGIHPKVAEKLSGADFDGDTVLVIPNNSRKIRTGETLAGLKGFDPKAAYPGYPGMEPIKPKTKQIEMGNVSNLITDMTIRGASMDKIARAVRHSMVVIDAEKWNLNYKQSAIDNGITQLKQEYQGSGKSGASTLISRASSEKRVPERKERPAARGGPIDPATGKLVFEPTGRTFIDKKGRVQPKVTKTTKLADEEDAFRLSSGTEIERVYAEHSNKLKAMANTARREAVHTKATPYSPSAKVAYRKDVADLNSALKVAVKNRPLERQAQLLANATVRLKRQANPDMDDDELKKVRYQALREARNRTGADKSRIILTDSQWEAIQAGAISNHKLNEILTYADLDQVKKLATPKTALLMTTTKRRRAQSMLNSGYTQREVADALGVSLTTLKNSLV